MYIQFSTEMKQKIIQQKKNSVLCFVYTALICFSYMFCSIKTGLHNNKIPFVENVIVYTEKILFVITL